MIQFGHDQGAHADPSRRAEVGELALYRALGIAFLVLEIGDGCPACARLAGRLFAIDAAPTLPIQECSDICCCRLAPFGLD